MEVGTCCWQVSSRGDPRAGWRTAASDGRRRRAWQRQTGNGSGSATAADSDIDTGERGELLLPQRVVWHWGWGLAHVPELALNQQRARLFAPLHRTSVGHQPVVADLDEALRQDVADKAPNEVGQREGDRLVAAGAEGDAAFVEGVQSMIADTNAVGVAAQVLEDLIRACKRGLTVDIPAGGVELLDERIEGVSGEVESTDTLPTQATEPVEELASKELGHDSDREQVVAARVAPGAVPGEAPQT